jgi:hypothetical protein
MPLLWPASWRVYGVSYRGAGHTLGADPNGENPYDKCGHAMFDVEDALGGQQQCDTWIAIFLGA